MRIEHVPVKTRKTAVNRMPWASKIVKVDGGYTGFESITDYQIWKRNK